MYEERDLYLDIVARRYDGVVVSYRTEARFFTDARGNDYILLKRPDGSWSAPKANEVPAQVWDDGDFVPVESALPDLLDYFAATRKA